MSHSVSPPDSADGVDRAALVQSIRQMELATDAIYMNAMSISRLIGLTPADIPRLCAMAACRMVERMMEGYIQRRAAPDLSDEERQRRQTEIRSASADLLQTLRDAITSNEAIQHAFAQKETVQ